MSDPRVKGMANAGWLHHAPEDLTAVLQTLTNNELHEAAMAFETSISSEMLKKHRSEILSAKLYGLFRSLRECPLQTLREMVSCGTLQRQMSRSALQAKYVQETFGDKLFKKVTLMAECVPPKGFEKEVADDTKVQVLKMTERDVVSILKNRNEQNMRKHLMGLHPCRKWEKKCRVNLRRCRLATLKIVFARYVLQRVKEYESGGRAACVYTLNCLRPFESSTETLGTQALLRECFRREFPQEIVNFLLREQMQTETGQNNDESEAVGERDLGLWPPKHDEKFRISKMRQYWEATKYKVPPLCAVCARSRMTAKVEKIVIEKESYDKLNMHLLKISDEHILKKVRQGQTHFCYENVNIHEHFLSKDAVGIREGAKEVCASICDECQRSLQQGKLPKYSLANNLYRGELPEQFRDLTWVEEQVCSLYRCTATVTRLFNDDKMPNVFYGNTCAHEMNISSTMEVLPRTPADECGLLSVIFIGMSPLKKASLKTAFRVRKAKIWAFLNWLKNNNKLYASVKLNEESMNLYPDDGALPGIETRVLQNTANSESTFAEETAGLDEHPLLGAIQVDATGEGVRRDDNEIHVELEHTGVIDPDGSAIPARTLQASAFAKLAKVAATNELADLYISNGKDAIREYNNTNLLPGMFPTLYPYGIGGFEDSSRNRAISFEDQASYCLDLGDRSLRKHRTWLFVVLNMIQRRQAHLHSYLTVQRTSIGRLKQILDNVTADKLQELADIVKNEKTVKLTEEQRRLMKSMQLVNTVASKLPGSHAAKLQARNECIAYCGAFGIPLFYLTINPNPLNSPVFSLMAGDEEVNLDERYPQLKPKRERTKMLVEDPVAAADFYEFSIRYIFDDLFGWDFEKGESWIEGGILGKLRGFKGTHEFTERGCLHGHFLLWIDGALNPEQMHEKMRRDVAYRKEVLSFLDEAIRHDLPDVELPSEQDRTVDPRHFRPPEPPNLKPEYTEEEYEQIVAEWKAIMDSDVKFLGEKVQRHYCLRVCHKYGNHDKCRFLFPHEVVEAAWFDEASNSVILAVRDATVNWHSPIILVMCRHNHDLRFLLSGKSAKAAVFYISDYITKMDLKTSEILSLMGSAVLKAFEGGEPPKDCGMSISDSCKKLLQKCITQFGRSRQLHAQQAAR